MHRIISTLEIPERGSPIKSLDDQGGTPERQSASIDMRHAGRQGRLAISFASTV